MEEQKRIAVGRLQAGVAEAEITCAVGAELAAELNPRVSQGIGMPLMAKAVVFSDGTQKLAIVALDLFGLRPDAAERLSAAIGARCGLPPEAIMVVCSRTQGAPYTAPLVGWPGVDENYLAHLAERVPGVVAEAEARVAPASLGVGRAWLPHLVYNHRLETRNMKTISAWLGVPRDEVLQPEGPTDPEFTVYVVRDDRGFPLCLLWNMAADHRFAADDLISSGLPGAVQRQLDERLGRHVISLCLPGCGGNVSYRLGLDETADAVASAVMAVQLETPCDPMIRLGCASEDVILPIRDYSRFWDQADIELKAPQAVEAFSQEVTRLQEEGARAVPARVQAFRLGRWALAGLPGVPFVEFGLRIKEASPFQTTVAVGNVGGYVGYLVTEAGFERGGFETWTARSAKVGRGGGEFVAEEAIGLLKSLSRA